MVMQMSVSSNKLMFAIQTPMKIRMTDGFSIGNKIVKLKFQLKTATTHKLHARARV